MNPIKTKSKMKKTMKKFLSMAALALVGAVMTGCSSDDDSIISNQQQFENKSKVVTLTTTVGFDASAGTRALTSTGVKTFAAGETMAIVYKNTAGETVKAVSAALTDGDITTTGDDATNKKSATFTFELTDPDRTVPVRYIYPAAMAKNVAIDAAIDDANTINYDALATQDGMLGTLSSTLDLATGGGEWDDGKLPTGTLENQLAILAITLKDGSEITSSITDMTISDGTNNYTVSRSAVAGPIYVAIQPTDHADIDVTATDGTKNYVKYLTSKDYVKIMAILLSGQ